MLEKVGRAILLGKYGFAKARDAILCVSLPKIKITKKKIIRSLIVAEGLS